MCEAFRIFHPPGLTASIDALQKLWSAEMNRVRLSWFKNMLLKQSEAELWAKTVEHQFRVQNDSKSSVTARPVGRNMYVCIYLLLF